MEIGWDKLKRKEELLQRRPQRKTDRISRTTPARRIQETGGVQGCKMRGKEQISGTVRARADTSCKLRFQQASGLRNKCHIGEVEA